MNLLDLAKIRPPKINRFDESNRLELYELYLAWACGEIESMDLMRVLDASSTSVRRDAADALRSMCEEGLISIKKTLKWNEAVRAAGKGGGKA